MHKTESLPCTVYKMKTWKGWEIQYPERPSHKPCHPQGLAEEKHLLTPTASPTLCPNHPALTGMPSLCHCVMLLQEAVLVISCKKSVKVNGRQGRFPWIPFQSSWLCAGPKRREKNPLRGSQAPNTCPLAIAKGFCSITRQIGWTLHTEVLRLQTISEQNICRMW